MIAISFLIIVASFESSCASSSSSFSNTFLGSLPIKGRIISGRSAFQGQFPFYVLLQKHINHGTHGGGSLLSSDWVLTAAHVVRGLESVEVIFGISKILTKHPYHMTARHMYAHPGYNNEVMSNDIALIKLPELVTFGEHIQPILLPTFSMVDKRLIGASIVAMGFGHTSDHYRRQLPDSLQYTKLKIIDNDHCAKKLGRDVPDVIFCADGATCNGDSGGPALLRNANGEFMQIGVISFGGNHRCELPLPVGLTRISSFLEWINDATGLVVP